MRTVLHIAAFVAGFMFGTAFYLRGAESPGQADFEKRCSGCHGVDSAKEGPALRGVVGRPAGKQPQFSYSGGLESATFRWDKAALDKWLTDPESVVPGTDMAFRLGDKAERQRIIEYLDQLK